jgi:hypothetical protein
LHSQRGPYGVPRNREVENCQAGMCLTAERPADLSRKGVEATRRVFRYPLLPPRSEVEPTHMGAWRRQGRRPGGTGSARMSQGLRAYRARRRATTALANGNIVVGRSLSQGPRGRKLSCEGCACHGNRTIPGRAGNQLLDRDAFPVETTDARRR